MKNSQKLLWAVALLILLRVRFVNAESQVAIDFKGCGKHCLHKGSPALATVNFEEGLLTIAGSTFRQTALKSVSFPSTLTDKHVKTFAIPATNTHLQAINGIVYTKPESSLDPIRAIICPPAKTGDVTVPSNTV